MPAEGSASIEKYFWRDTAEMRRSTPGAYYPTATFMALATLRDRLQPPIHGDGSAFAYFQSLEGIRRALTNISSLLTSWPARPARPAPRWRRRICRRPIPFRSHLWTGVVRHSKDISVPEQFFLSSESVSEEIRRIYPVFDLIARRNDAAPRPEKVIREPGRESSV